jgi:hypothetical protein
MAQYVIDLIRGRAAPPSDSRRFADSRHFLADTDAEAIEAADAISFGEIAGDPHVTGYIDSERRAGTAIASSMKASENAP